MFRTVEVQQQRGRKLYRECLLSGIFDLEEECPQRDVSEDLFSDISSVDEELLRSSGGRMKRLGKYDGEYKIKEYAKKDKISGKSFLN